MFKYRSLVIVLVLVSCTPLVEEKYINPEHGHYTEVMIKTDSILSFADTKIDKIKQNNLDQKLYIDSLRYEIDTEQNTINNIQSSLVKKLNVGEVLVSPPPNIEESIVRCKRRVQELTTLNTLRGEELDELNEVFDMKLSEFMDKIEYYSNREVKLIDDYNHKIDSLTSIIDSHPKIKKRGRKNRK